MKRIALLLTALSVSTWANNENPISTQAGLSRDIVNRGFEEMAPIVTEVSVQKGDPFVEVFISGYVKSDFCFDKKEYAVETQDGETHILVRFRRSNPEIACKGGKKFFSDKAADLDPNNPASKVVKVLGYYGWHEARLTEAPAAR